VQNKGEGMEHYHETVFKEESALLANIRQSLELKSEVLDAFTLIRKKGFARSDKDLEQIRKILAKYSKLNPNKLSFTDKYHLNYLNTVYYSSSGDHQKSVVYTQRNVKLLESISPRLREEEFEKHLVTLNNLVVNYIQLQRLNDTGPYMEKIRSLATHNIRENVLLWATSYKLVLGVSILKGDYRHGARVSNEILEGINFYSDKIPVSDIVAFKYNIATVFFANEEHSRSVRLLNEIINDNELSLRDDIQAFARILRIIVFWEKGEHDIPFPL
jgi:hypothetical protein